MAFRADPLERLGDRDSTLVAELARALSVGAGVAGLVWRSHLETLQRQARHNRDLVRILQMLGASVVLDHRVRVGGSHHQKFVVIRRRARPDSDVAFVGGIDLGFSRRDDATHRGDPQAMTTPSAFGPTPAWHDPHLEFTGRRWPTSSTASGNGGRTPPPRATCPGTGSTTASACGTGPPSACPRRGRRRLPAGRTPCSSCGPTPPS